MLPLEALGVAGAAHWRESGLNGGHAEAGGAEKQAGAGDSRVKHARAGDLCLLLKILTLIAFLMATGFQDSSSDALQTRS